jgi:hypothetical protein
MYILKRAAPDKPGMPLLGYFTVAGTALIGLLFVADAFMPKSAHSQFSSFEGLPAAYKGERMHSPAPPIAPTPPAAATAVAQAPAVETPPVVAEEAAKPAKHKVARKRQRRHDADEVRSGGDDFVSIWGEATRERSRRDMPSSWRETPSWRDTWASGDSEPRQRRGRRSASRPNDDFWAFR